MAIENRVCVTCNSGFYASSGAMYCSNKCKQAEYRRVNRTSGYIYRLIKSDVVVYVGQSHSEKTMKGRIHTHSGGELKKDFDRWDFYKVTGSSLSEAEALEIITEKPIYNKSIPHNDRYMTIKKAVALSDTFLAGIISDNCKTFTLSNDENSRDYYVDMNTLKDFKDYLLECTKFSRKITKQDQ